LLPLLCLHLDFSYSLFQLHSHPRTLCFWNLNPACSTCILSRVIFDHVFSFIAYHLSMESKSNISALLAELSQHGLALLLVWKHQSKLSSSSLITVPIPLIVAR
jgi:hypothetical protein